MAGDLKTPLFIRLGVQCWQSEWDFAQKLKSHIFSQSPNLTQYYMFLVKNTPRPSADKLCPEKAQKLEWSILKHSEGQMKPSLIATVKTQCKRSPRTECANPPNMRYVCLKPLWTFLGKMKWFKCIFKHWLIPYSIVGKRLRIHKFNL